MKKKLVQWTLSLVLVFVMAACSQDSPMSEVLNKVPADVDLVVVGDVKTVVENAGGSVAPGKIEIPAYIDEMMGESTMEELNSMKAKLEKSGANMEACAIFGCFDKESPIFLVGIDDEQAFTEALTQEGMEATVVAGENVYQTPLEYEWFSYRYYVYIHDGWAYFSTKIDEDDAKEWVLDVKNSIDAAKKSSFADGPFAEYITKGNAMGMALNFSDKIKEEMMENGLNVAMTDMYDGVFCLTVDLGATEAKANFKMFNKDGSEKNNETYAKLMDLSSTVSSEALQYMGKDDILVYALNMKDVDWNGIADMAQLPKDQRMAFTMVKAYLEKFDGTIAFGAGTKYSLSQLADMDEDEIVNCLSLTAVAETKDGEAEKLIQEAKSMLDAMSMAYVETDGVLSMPIPGGYGTVYMAQKGDMLVLANHAIEKASNVVVEKTAFSDYIFAMGLYLGKDHPILSNLGIANDVKAAFYGNAQKCEATLVVEMQGDKATGIIEKFANAALAAAKSM